MFDITFTLSSCQLTQRNESVHVLCWHVGRVRSEYAEWGGVSCHTVWQHWLLLPVNQATEAWHVPWSHRICCPGTRCVSLIFWISSELWWDVHYTWPWSFLYHCRLSHHCCQCCCCPRGKSFDPRGPIYKSLSLSSDLKSLTLSLSLDHKVLKNCRWLRILQTVRYVWTHEVHKFGYRHRAWGSGEERLTYWYQILLTDVYQ